MTLGRSWTYSKRGWSGLTAGNLKTDGGRRSCSDSVYCDEEGVRKGSLLYSVCCIHGESLDFGSIPKEVVSTKAVDSNDIDKSLNEAATDKIRKYRADYNYNPPTVDSFMTSIGSTSGKLHSEFIRLLFLQDHRETDRFFATSGVHLPQHDRGLFYFRRAAFSSQLKEKVGSTLAKAAALRVNLNIDGTPITSRTHTHPSHSQTSRVLTSSLSLGVPVPRATHCIRGV
jgi:hypothetical protein